MADLDTARPVVAAVRAAMERHDAAAAADLFAPDARLRSPLTARHVFTGRTEIGAVLTVVLDEFERLRYVDERADGDTGFLTSHAIVDGTEIETIDVLRVDDSARIAEMTVFFRPLPAATAALRLLGRGLLRPHGRVRAAAVSGATRPLVVMSRVGDVLGARMIRSATADGSPR